MLTFRIFIIGTANVGKSTITNSIVGHNVSKIGPSTDTTLSIIQIILPNNDFQVTIYDFPGIGGIKKFTLDGLIKNVKKLRKRRPIKGLETIPLENTALGEKIIRKGSLINTKRGRSLFLFVVDMVNGLKREDYILLKGIKKAFPRTSLLIVPNKIDHLDPFDIEESLRHYGFINGKNVICCSKKSEDSEPTIEKIANVLVEGVF